MVEVGRGPPESEAVCEPCVGHCGPPETLSRALPGPDKRPGLLSDAVFIRADPIGRVPLPSLLRQPLL